MNASDLPPRDVLDLGGECLDYTDGFLDAMRLSPRPPYCLEASVTHGTITRIYVAYMDKHPKLFDAPKRTGFLAALMDAYPCRAKK